MQVKDLMHENPILCTPETSLREAARMMVEHDCGSIPVIDDPHGRRLAGIITDRDVTCRTIPDGKNPLEMTVADAMTRQCFTVTPTQSVEECEKLMEERQVRRAPVVDPQGTCCGIVAQADIARKAPEGEAAEVLREVSRPTAAATA